VIPLTSWNTGEPLKHSQVSVASSPPRQPLASGDSVNFMVLSSLHDVQMTVTNVEVETQADGSLLVRWDFDGEPSFLDVATGPSPDHRAHRHETSVAASETQLRLPRPAYKRPFVSVAPHHGGPAVVAADRHVPFEGVTNFRDLGGYRSRFGGPIRWGMVFRADALHHLTEGDRTLYDLLGLRSVYDLRGSDEHERLPNPVPSQLLTIIGRPTADPGERQLEGTTTADGERFLCELYVGLVQHACVQIGELFTAFARADALPGVFHCHAGKDRTGVVAALLLEALGVERSTVLDDYELTARYRRRHHAQPSYQRLIDLGMSPEAAGAVLGTPRWAMQQALEHLDRCYGGIDAYLTGPAGMRQEDLERLRIRLVEGIDT